MQKECALELVNALASGVDPVTGEIFPPESSLQHPEIIRALYTASLALNAEAVNPKPVRVRSLPEKAGKPWSGDEDRELLAAFDSGRSEKELASAHQRTTFAIRSRLIRHGRLAVQSVAPTS